MKKLFSLYWKLCVVFISVFVTPAVIASVVTLDLNIYVHWITAPFYCVMMFILAVVFTGFSTEHLQEIS